MSNTSRASNVHERILLAARQLAGEMPLDRIGLSAVARKAGVSWPTVKRHLGSQCQLRQLLSRECPELGEALPDTRSRLIDAAIRVVARAGSARATLDDIAAEAGLTKGAVYWHFDNKRDLLLGLLDELERRQRREATWSAPPPAEDDASAALAGLLQRRVPVGADWSRLLFDFATSREPAIRARLAGVLAEAERELADAVRRLQQEGRIAPDRDAGELGGVLQLFVSGLFLAQLVDPERVDVAKLAGRVGDLLAAALPARGHGRPPTR